VIGLLAHVDTAPAFNATGVKPRVHRGYNGGTISFPDAPGVSLSPEVPPYLGRKIGDDIVAASGATLLGADDKAGVAIVMTAARPLLADPGIPHGKIRIAFTQDEEIGRGADKRLPGDLAAEIVSTLPQSTMTPEVTEDREGFLHVYQMGGTAAEVRMKLILRDF
jgi:tripeptide aminopeptidase